MSGKINIPAGIHSTKTIFVAIPSPALWVELPIPVIFIDLSGGVDGEMLDISPREVRPGFQGECDDTRDIRRGRRRSTMAQRTFVLADVCGNLLHQRYTSVSFRISRRWHDTLTMCSPPPLE